MATTAKSFICNGCGAPLKIPQNAKGVVVCPDCGKDCVLPKELIQNAEIAAKENINSGIPLEATTPILHRTLVHALAQAHSYMPLDLFETLEVIREEHYCVPSYLFECEADSRYSCEIGVERAIPDGNGGTVRRTEWNPFNGTVSETAAIIVSGDKEFTDRINFLYRDVSERCVDGLVDFEKLSFPEDVHTSSYDFPEVAAKKHARAHMEELLTQKINKTLESKEAYRGVTMDGTKMADKMTRIFLGVYRLIYRYGDTEYCLWCSNDGDRWTWEKMPEDSQRMKKHEELKKILEAVPENQSTMYMIIAAVFCVLAIGASGGGWSIWLIVWLIGAGFCGVKLSSVIIAGKLNDKKRAKAQQELDIFEEEWLGVVNKFIENKTALNGIYAEACTGVSEAFRP